MELRYVGSNDHLIRVKLGSFTFDVTLDKFHLFNQTSPDENEGEGVAQIENSNLNNMLGPFAIDVTWNWK
jgi:hypothetical protein